MTTPCPICGKRCEEDVKRALPDAELHGSIVGGYMIWSATARGMIGESTESRMSNKAEAEAWHSAAQRPEVKATRDTRNQESNCQTPRGCDVQKEESARPSSLELPTPLVAERKDEPLNNLADLLTEAEAVPVINGVRIEPLPALDITEEDIEIGIAISEKTPGSFLKTQGDCNFAGRLACRERQLRAALADVRDAEERGFNDCREKAANTAKNYDGYAYEDGNVELPSLILNLKHSEGK